MYIKLAVVVVLCVSFGFVVGIVGCPLDLLFGFVVEVIFCSGVFYVWFLFCSCVIVAEFVRWLSSL